MSFLLLLLLHFLLLVIYTIIAIIIDIFAIIVMDCKCIISNKFILIHFVIQISIHNFKYFLATESSQIHCCLLFTQFSISILIKEHHKNNRFHYFPLLWSYQLILICLYLLVVPLEHFEQF